MSWADPPRLYQKQKHQRRCCSEFIGKTIDWWTGASTERDLELIIRRGGPDLLVFRVAPGKLGVRFQERRSTEYKTVTFVQTSENDFREHMQEWQSEGGR